MIIGIIFIVFGALLLLQNIGIITYSVWGIFILIVIIAIGMKIAMKKGHGHHWCCHPHKGGEDKDK